MSDKTFYDPRIHDQLDSRYFMTTSQSIRLQLVIELIRAGRIDDFLSLAHEAEQFVINGMENKPVDGPADPDSSWPQTKEEVVSAPSIQAGFNEKWKVKDLPNGGWHIPNPELDASAESANKEMFKKLVLGNVEAPIDPSQEEVHEGGESAEPQMTLWEMCQAIFEDETGSNVLSDKGWILKHDMDNVFNLWDGNCRNAKLVLGENDFFISRETSDGNGIREILMGFPPFKK